MSVEAWTFAVNAATFVIGSASGREGKDKESWDSYTICDGPAGMSSNDVSRCLFAGLGGVRAGSTIESARLATSVSKAASECGADSVAFLSSVECTKRSSASCYMRVAIVDR